MSHNVNSFRDRFAVFVTFLAILAAPSSVFAADPKIDLDVVSSGGGAKLQFLNSACPSDPGYAGCVDVAKGSKNWIGWELSQEAWQDGWVITGLQLMLEDPALTDCIVRDFNVDRNTGDANDFRVQGNGKFGRNWDENSCDFAYEVAYLVFARNNNTGEEANSDPVIRNGGRN